MQDSLAALIPLIADQRQEREEFLGLAETLAGLSRSGDRVFCRWMIDALREIPRRDLDRRQSASYDRVIQFYREWESHRCPEVRRWKQLRAEVIDLLTPVIARSVSRPAEELTKEILLTARAATDNLIEFVEYAIAVHMRLASNASPFEIKFATWFRYTKRLLFYLQLLRQPRSETEASFQEQILHGDYTLLPIYCDWLEEEADPILEWLR